MRPHPSAPVAGRVVIVRRPPFGQWAGGVALAVFAAWVVFQLVTNAGFEWPVVAAFMLDRSVLAGLQTTCVLTVLVMLIGVAVGLVLAMLTLSGGGVGALGAGLYIWFFRGTPVLVQLVFWYNLASLFPTIALGVPFGGPKLFAVPSTVAISSFTAALLGLGLNEGAYMAEIIRAGLLSVPPGQSEAARALGYRRVQAFRTVVLPQAMRAILPPTGNQVIGMLKFTSLASVVALPELMEAVENIYSRTFQTIPLLIVAALWYLVLTSVLSLAQRWVERRYGRGR